MSVLTRLSFVLALVACASLPAPATVPASGPAARSLRVSAEGAGEGRLVWAWIPEQSAALITSGQARDIHIAELIDALRVSEPIDFTQAGESDLAVPPPTELGRYFVIFQPPGADLWAALQGGGGEEQWAGWSPALGPEDSEFTITLEQGRAHGETEQCTGEGFEALVLESPEVAGLIGNETHRRLCVMLPPGYAETEQRFPVVYLQPGYGGSDTVYRHLRESDADVILVGVDGRTGFGTTYFRNTRYAGQWETFLTRVVAHIDGRYRTQANVEHRALLGHSTGGYNAITLALRRGDLFGAAAASSPDGLDLERWLLEGDAVGATWLQWTRLEVEADTPGQMVSYAVQFDDASELGQLRFPYDLQSGELDERWTHWLAEQPMTILSDESRHTAIRARLSGRLFISVGREDAFQLYAPAESFHERLDALNIPHAWIPTEGGHFTGSSERRAAGLEYLLGAFADAH